MAQLRAFPPVKVFSWSYLSQDTVLKEITKYLELAERDACFQPNARLTSDGPVPAYEDSEVNLALSHLERIQAGLNGEVLKTDPDEPALAGTKEGLDPDGMGHLTAAQRKRAMGVNYQVDGVDYDHQPTTAPDMGQDGWQDKEEYERQQEDITEGDMDAMTYDHGGRAIRETPTIVRGDLLEAEKSKKAAKKERRKEDKRQREELRMTAREEQALQNGAIDESPIKDLNGYHDAEETVTRKRSNNSDEHRNQNGYDDHDFAKPKKKRKTDHDSSET